MCIRDRYYTKIKKNLPIQVKPPALKILLIQLYNNLQFSVRYSTIIIVLMTQIFKYKILVINKCKVSITQMCIRDRP